MRLACVLTSALCALLAGCGGPSEIQTVHAQADAVDGRSLDDWAAAIRASDTRQRPASIRKLAGFGATALPLLATYLDEGGSDGTSSRVSEAVFRAVASIKPQDSAWATRASHAIRTGSSPVRTAAAEALTSMDQHGLAALDGLLADTDERIRTRAAFVLASMPVSDAVTRRQCALATDSYWVVRREAARALANPGVVPQACVREAVATLLQDGSPDVQAHAASASAQFSSDATIRAETLRLLDSPHGKVRGAAARVLGFGSASKAALVVRLATMSARDESIDARVGAALGHWRATGSVETARPILLAALRHARVRIRRLALRGIGQLGADAAPLVQAVADRLQDRSVRVAAIDALATLGRAARPAVPALRQARAAARPYTASRIDAALEQIEG